MPKKNAKTKALELAKMAAKKIPAYKKFVAKLSSQAKTLEDFPITTKENYIHRYNWRDRQLNGSFPEFAYASSGSSGTPTFWFRNQEQLEAGVLMHERLLVENFKIKKNETTLVVVCFSMGIWVAGGYTADCFHELYKLGYKITIVTPGIAKTDILNVLKNLAPDFDNVILAGYPSFIADVIRGTDLSKRQKFFVLTAGDSFSEEWRNEVSKSLRIKQPEQIISLYGCADAGVLAYETKESILIRQLAKNTNFAKSLFGSNTIGALFSYDPDLVFFESLAGNLIFTAHTATPLIRYNIHDLGFIYSAKDILSLAQEALNKKDFSILKKLLSGSKLQFVAKSGRSDVAVTFYSLNIYPEHIQKVFQHKLAPSILSGSYRVYTIDKGGRVPERLFIEFESRKQLADRQTEILQKAVFETLYRVNIEYRKLYESLGDRVKPIVKPFSPNNNARRSTKMLFQSLGKKPKIIIS